MARIKAEKDAIAKASSAVNTNADAHSSQGLSLAQLEPLLDRWSLGRVVQVADEALTRK